MRRWRDARALTSALCGAVLAMCLAAGPTRAMNMLHTSGTNIFDSSNNYVHFTGEDIGGWLVTENWMCPIDNSGLPDMYSIEHELDTRFGVSTEQSMISSYQADWITAADLQNIKNRGDNCVRVPVWWGDFYALSALGANSPSLRSDAFTKLDWIVNECSSIGLYVVIDMHGVFGGQSTSPDTGYQNQNQYWSNGNDQGNTALLWWEIASHYNGNGTVAGYDLINEPTGAPSTSAVWTAYSNLYNTVRSADPTHIIFMEGTFGSWDWSMLPAPSTYGWTNVVYEMHEYQNGGDTAQVEQGCTNQVNDFNNHKSWNVPDFIGEFNDMGNGITCWNWTITQYNDDGINWNMWAYKSTHGLNPDSWGFYDPKAWVTTPNVETNSESTILSDWAEWTTSSDFVQNTTVL